MRRGTERLAESQSSPQCKRSLAFHCTSTRGLWTANRRREAGKLLHFIAVNNDELSFAAIEQ